MLLNFGIPYISQNTSIYLYKIVCVCVFVIISPKISGNKLKNLSEAIHDCYEATKPTSQILKTNQKNFIHRILLTPFRKLFKLFRFVFLQLIFVFIEIFISLKLSGSFSTNLKMLKFS